MQGLYIHIPVCVKKCSYCDFYSLPGRLDMIGNYVQAVLQEAEHYKGMSFYTLFIGGGTPSLLGAKYLRMLMEGLDKTLRLPRRSAPRNGDEYEATIEVNPESATEEFLKAAKETGFNRVSIGVQSLADDELRSVGRIHTAGQAVEAIRQAKKAGFEAISADLIIGLPGQTWTSLRNSLKTLVEMEVGHISAYCLSLEEGTILGNKPPENLPDDEMQANLYEETRKFLKSCGYAHYEISNFARRGCECMHNINYWRGGEYLGLGTAAASHIEGRRWRNRADLDSYIQSPTTQIEEIEVLGIEEKAAEEAMLRLRLLEEGVDIVELADRYEWDSIKGIVERLEEMAREGLLVKWGTRYRLSEDKVLTSNRIFERVISKY